MAKGNLTGKIYRKAKIMCDGSEETDFRNGCFSSTNRLNCTLNA